MGQWADSKPFQSETLEEDREERKRLTVNFNESEEKRLLLGCKLLNSKEEGRVLKALAWIGLNVILRDFGVPFCKYFFKKQRSRLNDKGNFPTLNDTQIGRILRDI